MKHIKLFEDFVNVNEGYLSVGNTVKVTYPEHKDVDKIGVITDRDGDFLTVDMGTHKIKINASSIVDLGVNENVNEGVSELEKLENELEKEVEWVRKYNKYIDKGSYPKYDYDDEDEFYSDLEKTEANIERLNKLIRNKKK